MVEPALTAGAVDAHEPVEERLLGGTSAEGALGEVGQAGASLSFVGRAFAAGKDRLGHGGLPFGRQGAFPLDPVDPERRRRTHAGLLASGLIAFQVQFDLTLLAEDECPRAVRRDVHAQFHHLRVRDATGHLTGLEEREVLLAGKARTDGQVASFLRGVRGRADAEP